VPLHFIGLELTILLAFWLALAVLDKNRSTAGRITFVALCWAAIFWCGGELLALRSSLSEVVTDRIRYVGILGLAPLWLGVAAHASGIELARRVPWFPLVLLAPQVVPYAMLFSPTWSGLFVETRPDAPDAFGPLWWVSMLYAYVLVVTGSSLLIVSALRVRATGRWTRRLAVGLAALVPLMGNAGYLAAGMRWSVDPTPLLLGVALLALRGAIFTGHLLQVLPVSHHDLLRQLPVGVILTDRRGVVIDVNPAAERRLGVSEKSAVRRSLDAILTEAGSDVHAEIAPIRSRDREAGQLVLIDPPAKPVA
jgi:PAS domain-containing protein